VVGKIFDTAGNNFYISAIPLIQQSGTDGAV